MSEEIIEIRGKKKNIDQILSMTRLIKNFRYRQQLNHLTRSGYGQKRKEAYEFSETIIIR